MSDLTPGDTRLARNRPPGQDLRLIYRSEIDESHQPYALYVPSGYDRRSPWPLIINLHGTSAGRGEELVGQASKSYTADRNALFLWAAERHGALLATPYGRGITEFRGTGENDVFRVLEEVQRQYNVDADRVALTGLSMGGTASYELGLHHPGVFSAVAPIAAAHSFEWLAANGQHIPFWCIGGEHDRDFIKHGGLSCAKLMIEKGYPTRLSVLETREHGDFIPELFDRVVEWLLRHRLVRHPSEYAFSAVLPMFGQAYWTAIDAISEPGPVATINARVVSPTHISLKTENTTALAVLPDCALIDMTRPLEFEIDGQSTITSTVAPDLEVMLTKEEGRWRAAVGPRREISLTAHRTHPVAEAPRQLTMQGVEAPLANWIADAIRAAAGTDIALYNRRYHRGQPIEKGVVDEVDFVQCSRPFDQLLGVTQLTGRDVVDILEDNIEVPEALRHGFPLSFTDPDVEYLVHPSGFTYAFDRNRPVGRRVVACDLDPTRRYSVAVEGQVPERADVWRRCTIRLADNYPLDYEVTRIPLRGALYAHAKRTGRIEAPASRVRAV